MGQGPMGTRTNSRSPNEGTLERNYTPAPGLEANVAMVDALSWDDPKLGYGADINLFDASNPEDNPLRHEWDKKATVLYSGNIIGAGLYNFALGLYKNPDAILVAGHGNRYKFDSGKIIPGVVTIGSGNNKSTVEVLFNKIKSLPRYTQTIPIVLLVCHAGEKGKESYAQKLADKLVTFKDGKIFNNPVIAPTEYYMMGSVRTLIPFTDLSQMKGKPAGWFLFLGSGIKNKQIDPVYLGGLSHDQALNNFFRKEGKSWDPIKGNRFL